MVFTVHTQFSGTTTSNNYNVFVGASFNQGSSVDECVGWASAEAADVTTGSIVQTSNLSSSFCEVAATTLVHITTSLFTAVDNVVDLVFVDAGNTDQVQQGQNSRCFGNHVLQHGVSGEVFVNVMCSLNETDGFAAIYQWFSMLFVYKVLNLGSVNAFVDSSNDALVDYWVSSKFIFYLSYELFIQHNQLENVYALHQHVELIFRHDFAEFTLSLVQAVNGGVYPWLWVFCQFVWMHIADVSLVWQICQSLLVSSDVIWKFFEVLRTWVYDFLGGLGGTIFHYHVWCMGKNVACAFDYTVHCSHASHSFY